MYIIEHNNLTENDLFYPIQIFTPPDGLMNLPNRKQILEKFDWMEGIDTHIFHKEHNSIRIYWKSCKGNDLLQFDLEETKKNFFKFSRPFQKEILNIIYELTKI